MKDKIDNAIIALSAKISEDTPSSEALHITQAILNLANARARLDDLNGGD